MIFFYLNPVVGESMFGADYIKGLKVGFEQWYADLPSNTASTVSETFLGTFIASVIILNQASDLDPLDSATKIALHSTIASAVYACATPFFKKMKDKGNRLGDWESISRIMVALFAAGTVTEVFGAGGIHSLMNNKQLRPYLITKVFFIRMKNDFKDLNKGLRMI